MNKSRRQLTFFIAIFAVMFIGPLLLGWSTFESIIVVAFMALVMKLTDIEDTLGEIK